MTYFLALLATSVLWFLSRRYTTYFQTEFSTQNTVDPRMVPGETPSEATGTTQEDDNANIIEVTNSVTLPMAQIASSFGTEFSPNALNPVIPKAGYANTYLDLPFSIFNSPETPKEN